MAGTLVQLLGAAALLLLWTVAGAATDHCTPLCTCWHDAGAKCEDDELQELPAGLPETLSALRARLPQLRELTAETAAPLGCPELKILELYGGGLETIAASGFDGLRRLQELRLPGGQITHLDPDAFPESLLVLRITDHPLQLPDEGPLLRLPHLSLLDLSGCGLADLPPDVFSGTPELEKLVLSRNQLRALPAAVFKPLPQLKWLTADDNQLAQLAADTFADNPRLQVLSLEDNPLEGGGCEDGPPLLESGSLQRLALTGHRLAGLPPRFFSGLPQLRQLVVSGLRLAEQQDDQFKRCCCWQHCVPLRQVAPDSAMQGSLRAQPRPGKWTKCVMSCPRAHPFCSAEAPQGERGCPLAEAEFEHQPELQLLDLSGNRLRDLHAAAFPASLVSLVLSFNPLQLPSEGPLVSLPKLDWLELDHCGLTELPPDVLTGVPALTVLSLRGNQLTQLPGSAMAAVSRLEWAYLGHNQLTELDPDAFAGNSKLKALVLEGNRVAGPAAEGGPLLNCPSLLSLDLDNNRLKRPPPGSFDGLAHLQELSMAGNGMTELPEETFQPLEELQKLSLADNNLQSLPEGALKTMGRLIRLVLTNNSLGPAPEGPLLSSQRLRQLDLAGNELAELPASSLAGVPNLRTLGLSSNPEARVDLPALGEALPHLEELWMDDTAGACPCLPDEARTWARNRSVNLFANCRGQRPARC